MIHTATVMLKDSCDCSKNHELQGAFICCSNRLLTGNTHRCEHLNIDTGRSFKDISLWQNWDTTSHWKEQGKYSNSNTAPLRHSKARQICWEIKDLKRSFKLAYVPIKNIKYIHMYLFIDRSKPILSWDQLKLQLLLEFTTMTWTKIGVMLTVLSSHRVSMSSWICLLLWIIWNLQQTNPH